MSAFQDCLAICVKRAAGWRERASVAQKCGARGAEKIGGGVGWCREAAGVGLRARAKRGEGCGWWPRGPSGDDRSCGSAMCAMMTALDFGRQIASFRSSASGREIGCCVAWAPPTAVHNDALDAGEVTRCQACGLRSFVPRMLPVLNDLFVGQ